MRDEIYDYLISIGFTNENIRKIEKNNSEIFYVFLKDVKDNVNFFLNKGFSEEELIQIINNNPFILTDEKNRRDYYDNIYLDILHFNNEEMIKLIRSNNDAYTSNPIELKSIIEYFSYKFSINEIKKLILANSKIITMKLFEVKDIVKLV